MVRRHKFLKKSEYFFFIFLKQHVHTIPWAIKVSPITNSYLGHMALFIVTELTKLQSKWYFGWFFFIEARKIKLQKTSVS